MNIDFLAPESSVFHLDLDPARVFSELYRDSTTAFSQDLASKLFTVCAALHEFPTVRCRPDSPMEV